jgi:hypothetical protein
MDTVEAPPLPPVRFLAVMTADHGDVYPTLFSLTMREHLEAVFGADRITELR